MMTRFQKTFLLALLAGLHMVGGARAQNLPLGNIIGGVLQAAAAENARKEWAELPDIYRFCLNSGLRPNGTDSNRLAQQGVRPSDQRLENLLATCRGLIARELRPDIECTKATTNGRTYSTRCRETYARNDGRGSLSSIELPEAITETFAGRRVEVGNAERMDAANRWREQLAAGGPQTRVVSPTFSCEKARAGVETAICNSYELTLYDNQYADLWARAKPLDPKGEIAKQLAARNKAREACNASVPCIRDATEQGIAIVGTFLRTKGVTVVTFADEAAARRQREVDEQARREEAARQRAEQARLDAEAAREAARLRAEQAKAEAEAAREAALRRQEEARTREADTAEFNAFLREEVAAWRAAKTGDFPFLPPHKVELSAEEAKLAEGPCGGAIRGQDVRIAAYRLLRSVNSDLVQRSCRVELGLAELTEGRREQGIALLGLGLARAQNATGRLFLGWTNLVKEATKDGETTRAKSCAAIAAKQDAYLGAPSRLRDGKTIVIAGVPMAFMLSLGCDADTPPVTLLGQQTKLCALPAPAGPLDALAEQSSKTCWIVPAAHADFRARLAARLTKETGETFEEQRLAKAVSVSSAERRAFGDAYEACFDQIKAYGSAAPGDLATASEKITGLCRDFLKN